MGIRVVGLTGGIASGKSTVSRMLRDMAVPVVDADAIARQVVEGSSPVVDRLREAFGSEVIGPGGSLDRKKLGERIFADPDARKTLNALLHPAIWARSREELASLEQAGHRIAVYDAALILENDRADDLDALIVVAVSEPEQIRRLMDRDGIGRVAALTRIGAQMPLSEKIRRADWVVDNSGTLEQTRQRLGAVWAEVLRRFGA